jgi:hypothetical protein
MAIHKVEGGYAISSGGVWLPGAYEDERTARYAFRLPDAVLQRLQDDANARMPDGKGGTVTWGDVARAARRYSLSHASHLAGGGS